MLYGVLGLIELCLALAAAENLSNDPSGFTGAWWVLSSLVLGLSISAIQMSFVGKPLAFMLPGHERGVRQVLFGTGPIVIGIFSLVFLYYPDLSQTALVGLYLSAFCLGLFCYWLGVGVILIWGMKFVAILFVFGVIVVSAGRWIEWFILHLPILSIGLGAAATGGFWWLLNQPEFLKHYCRQTWYQSATIAATKRRQPNFEDQSPLPARRSQLEIRTEQFFLNRMQACKSRGMSRYLWGQLYEKLGQVIRCFHPLLDISQSLLYICIFGYLIIEGAKDTSVFVFLMITVVGLQYFNFGYSTLVINGGRREMFVSTIMNSSVLAALLTIFLIIAALLTIPLERVLPSIDPGRYDPYVFHALPLRFCCVPLFMVPLYHSMNLCFRNMPFVGKFGGLLVCVIVPMVLFSEIRKMPNTVILTLTACLICFSWLIFVVVCRYVFRKWSLVRA